MKLQNKDPFSGQYYTIIPEVNLVLACKTICVEIVSTCDCIDSYAFCTVGTFTPLSL